MADLSDQKRSGTAIKVCSGDRGRQKGPGTKRNQEQGVPYVVIRVDQPDQERIGYGTSLQHREQGRPEGPGRESEPYEEVEPPARLPGNDDYND